MRKTERIARKASKSVSKLGNRIGDIIENMVGGNTIVRKFNKLGYKIERFCRNQSFGRDLPKDMRGEIDLLLENGDIAILIEVKDRSKVAVQDNGPGIVKKQISLIFGKLLYGSKFHRMPGKCVIS